MLKIYRDDFDFSITILSIVSSLLHLFKDSDFFLDFLEKKRDVQEQNDA